MEANQFALLLRELEGIRKELAAANKYRESIADSLGSLAENFESATSRDGSRKLAVDVAQ